MSSTTKLTLFARVPRNVTPGAKTSSIIGSTRIDAKYLAELERARTGQDLGTIMTKTDTTLNVEFNAQGTIGYALKSKDGSIKADQQDIGRIMALNASIASERKIAQKSEVSTNLRYTLAAYLRYAGQNNMVVDEIPPSFLEVFRGINVTMNALTRNLNSIEPIDVESSAADAIVKRMLLEYGKRIRCAIGNYLLHKLLLKDGEIPKKANRFLLEFRVPIYIYNKLTNASGLGTNQQNFNFRSLLFPSDPSKGFYLTFRECRDHLLISSSGGLLEGADLMLQIAHNDKLLRMLLNVPDSTILDNFEERDSFASKVASTPFWVPPFSGVIDQKSLMNFLARNGLRGVNWQSGSVLTAADNLKFVGTLGKRIAYGLLIRANLKKTLLANMFGEFEFSNDVENESLDIYVQLKEQRIVELPEHINWLHIATHKASYSQKHTVVKNVFADIAGLAPSHVISAEFGNMCRINDDNTFVPVLPGENVSVRDTFTEIKNLANQLRMNSEDPMTIIGGKFKGKLIGKGKKRRDETKRVGLIERSMLEPESKFVIEMMNRRGYAALADRMEGWFRQFLSRRVQAAVAELFSARLDAFLDHPIVLDRNERLAFLEPEALINPDAQSDDEADLDEAAADQDMRENPDDL